MARWKFTGTVEPELQLVTGIAPCKSRVAGGVDVTRSGQILGWCALSVFLLASPMPAAAQTYDTPMVEIGGAVQLLHIPDETYPFGVNVDLSGPVGDHDRIRWVGEGGMAQDRPIDVGDTLRFYHFGAGVRVTPRGRERATPFFQVLGGVANAWAAFSNSSVNAVDSAWGPMIQSGLGVAVPLNHWVAVVGQGDYRFAIFRGQVDNEFRLAFGARFMLW